MSFLVFTASGFALNAQVTPAESATTQKTDKKSASNDDDVDLISADVNGLGCPYCAFGLEKGFKEFKDIDDFKIDIETGTMTFNYPASKEMSIEQINEQIVKSGYTVSDIAITREDGTVESLDDFTIENNVVADSETVLKVAGNCGMCKGRIESTVLVLDGIKTAQWNDETEQITVEYDSKQIDEDTISKALAEAGHDTVKYKAAKKKYKSLPACCKYKRIK